MRIDTKNYEKLYSELEKLREMELKKLGSL